MEYLLCWKPYAMDSQKICSTEVAATPPPYPLTPAQILPCLQLPFLLMDGIFPTVRLSRPLPDISDVDFTDSPVRACVRAYACVCVRVHACVRA